MLKFISKILVLLAVMVSISTPTFAAKKSKKKDSVVDTRTQIMPTFQGEDYTVFRNWIISQINYPKKAVRKKIAGNVIISFLINKKGEPTDFEIVSTPDELLSDEVIRVVKLSPKWVPASKDGKYIPIKLVYNVTFTI